MIDYIGSKTKLLDWLFSTIQTVVGELEDKTFLDGCAGTGSVSFRAKKLGIKVHSNDLMAFSSTYIEGYSNISKDQLTIAECLVGAINALNGIEGTFYNTYSDAGGRLYFTKDNAKKIDAARQYIDTVPDLNIKNYLLACLLEATSRVANTAGTHGAYLKKFKERSLQPLVLRLEDYRPGKHPISSSNLDLLTYLNSIDLKFDIFYLDPPYTSRQYGPNYHLYETLIKNDNPKVHGKTGLRDWKQESNSLFCRDKEAENFYKSILSTVRSDYVFISYSSDGLLSKEKILEILAECRPTDKVSMETLPYKRYKSDSTRVYNESPLVEYLFISSKDK